MIRRALATATAVVLVVAVVAAVLDGDGRDGAGDAGEAATGADSGQAGVPTSTTTAAVEDVVETIQDFVEGVRGREFKTDVEVLLLEDDEFERRLLRDAEEDRADTELAERLLRAVGLVDDDVELHEVLLRFIGDAVIGFYDPETDELAVRGGRFTPYVRATLAHELTHALDDQWFDIHRPALRESDDDEAFLAFSSLVEGNAVRVEQAYRATLSDAERTQAGLEERRRAATIDLRGVPPVLPSLVGFPYAAGPPFVAALLAAGGEARVDEAFRAPPTTSADILDPAAWLAGQRPVSVPRPPAEGKVLDEGVFGMSSLLLTLEPVVGADDAVRAADGWAGDGYVAWDAGDGETCVRSTFAMRTSADVEELEDALDRWARRRRALVDRSGERVGFTVCG